MLSRKKLIQQGFLLFLFTSLVFALLATQYFQSFDKIEDFVTGLYLAIATLSHFTLLSFLLYTFLYLPTVALFPRRKIARVCSALLITISICLLILDTRVFKLYHFHINGFVLTLFFGKAGGQVFVFHTLQYVIVTAAFLMICGVVSFLTHLFFRFEIAASPKINWFAITIVLLMLIASHLMHAWADANNFSPITNLSRKYPLYFPTTAKSFMREAGFVNESTSKKNLSLSTSMWSGNLNYPRNPIQTDTSSKKPNIIVILIDSWYFKAFDSVAMPNLFKFSKQTETYNDHYSGSNGTRTGVFSLFYGIPGIFWDEVLASHASPVLMDVALAHEYDIKTFTSASLVDPPFDRTIFSKVETLNEETTGDQPYDRDEQLTKNWISVSENYKPGSNNHPVFSLLFYDALHAISHPPNYKGPFMPEWEYPRYESLHNDLDPTPFLNLYKNTAHFIDSLVGEVIIDLTKKELLQNSWVIITGDHGQEFNDNKRNYWGHNGNYTRAQMQVPLLIHKPGVKPKKISYWTSHYDVVPTVLSEVFKCTNPYSDYSIGKHLSDRTGRNWLLVGSHDSFAIVQPDKITSIYFDRSFDVTDSRLNPLDISDMDTELFNQIIFQTNSFYKKD